MTRNVGTVDRAVRIVAGLVLLIAPAAALTREPASAPWAYGIGAAGAVLLLTGFFGLCPAYRIIGMNTRGG